MYDLFSDQIESFDALRVAMKSHRDILLQASTGSGKTAIATNMIGGTRLRARRSIMSFPRVALLEQTSETFKKHDIPHSFIASGYPYNPFADVFLGMTETMAKRVTAGTMPKGINLHVPDETHVGDVALSCVIQHFKKPWFDGTAKQNWTYQVGLSATPQRMDGRGLGIHYDYMVQGRSIKWLIENKRLSDYLLFQGRIHADFHKLARMKDEDIAGVMDAKREIVGDCVKEYIDRAKGKLWVVRCTNIKHSEVTAQAFRDAGINAVHVDGETPKAEQKRIFKAYAAREILVLCFADLLNFGFDLAQAAGVENVCIEGGSDLKPSDSLAGQLQFWGRLLRWKLFPAFIHDHVNNFLRHGLPDDDREWTLDSLTKKQRGSEEKPPPTKQCPICLVTSYIAERCRNCGHYFEVAEMAAIKTVEGELHELDKEAFRRHSLAVQDPLDEFLPVVNQEERLERLIQYAAKEGIKNPITWAANELAKINEKSV